MQPLKDLRLDKDGFFAHHEQSPLTSAQKAEFQGLDYFPENRDNSQQIRHEAAGFKFRSARSAMTLVPSATLAGPRA